ncbi:DnaJ domain-containing protein [Oscillatoria sp. FACHB-1407]|uniref:J domain-containing protein n=1 Tax=Oscillatoria sp. FACHB-1407 TaxID=2692847 RepID=UPI0016869F0A|nr:J domain-containing protein [Oscillatoria sp. FACHB-1407]MBD2465449.1 DnaJ domain-containing protein [Oscillatoria sp. FACHB-1407]
MSFKIELGLFNLDCTDYHAILGVPVNADPGDIRKQYLKIARRLHPDSYATESEEDRKRAAEILSKLVNPAYEKLSNKENYTDHLLLVKLKGQQAARQQDTVMLVSESARRLASARGDIEQPYRVAMKELAAKQYEHLDQTLELTGQISELNLIYLMKTTGDDRRPIPRSYEDPSKKQDGPPPPPPPPGPPPRRETRDLIEGYYRRGKEFWGKGNSTGAIKEIRDGLELANKTPECTDLASDGHAFLGQIYLQGKQPTMAKVHFNQAFKLNSSNELARTGLQALDPNWKAPGEQASGSATKGAKPNPKGGKPNTSSGGGLFGGLFGGKKK